MKKWECEILEFLDDDLGHYNRNNELLIDKISWLCLALFTVCIFCAFNVSQLLDFIFIILMGIVLFRYKNNLNRLESERNLLIERKPVTITIENDKIYYLLSDDSKLESIMFKPENIKFNIEDKNCIDIQRKYIFLEN